MKVPSYARFEIYFSRIFDIKTYRSIVYIEEAVRITPKKSYVTCVITVDSMFVLTMNEKKDPVGTKWSNIDDIVTLNDAADIVPSAYSGCSTHVRVYVDDQVPTSERILDLYSIFDDSKLLFYIMQVWLHARMRVCFRVFYPKQGNLPKVSVARAQFLVRDFAKRMEEEPLIEKRTKLLEELTMTVCDSDHVKLVCFKNTTFLDFIIEEIRDNHDLKEYMDVGNEEGVIELVQQNKAKKITMAYIASKYRYLNTLLGFLVRLLSGFYLSRVITTTDKFEDQIPLLFPNDILSLTFFIKAIMMCEIQGATNFDAFDAKSYLEGKERERRVNAIRKRKLALATKLEEKMAEKVTKQSIEELAERAHKIAKRRGLPVDMVLATLKRRDARNAESRESTYTKVLKVELAGFDFNQMELFFLLTTTFTYAQLNEANVSVDQMFDKMLDDEEFVHKRIPQLITRLGQLLAHQVKVPHLGYYIYILTDILLKMLKRSADVRETIIRVCRNTLMLSLTQRNARTLITPEPEMFWYDVSYDKVMSLLDELKSGKN